MKHYDSIVVGAGASGLTLAMILASNGRKVLLLEKAPTIGGGLCRYYKNGVPFDTGFHFTGGFVNNTIMHDMLSVLGIREALHPIFLEQEGCNRFYFENEDLWVDIPPGFEACRLRFEQYFPREREAIRKYFHMIDGVVKATPSFDLSKISISPDPVNEDYVTLSSVLESLTSNQALRAALSVFCMCHGTRPSEISFANHARVSIGFYDTMVRIENGGDAFIQAFRKAIKNFPIDVLCNTTIQECLDIDNNIVRRFLLTNQEEILAQECIFTTHPHETLKLLPRKHFSKAFWDRVEGFESSNGFFSVFGVVDQNISGPIMLPNLVSTIPSTDINLLMDPAYDGPQALAIFQTLEHVRDKSFQVLNAFEPSFKEHVASWNDSRVGKRPADYYQYKEKHAQSICHRINTLFPSYQQAFKMFDAASMLTFRDYQLTPDGSAYGIKQRIGQFNLFGKLPLRNLYAAGQSAVLPGVLGAMLSSFVVARAILDKNIYQEFISRRLCR